MQLVYKRVGLARFFLSDHAYAYTDLHLDLLLGGAFFHAKVDFNLELAAQ